MPFSPEITDALRELGIPSGGSRDDDSPPIDLREIPLERWEEYDCFPLLVPPDVSAYVAGLTEPMTVLEKDHLEERVEAFLGVKAPWVVVWTADAARLMRDAAHPRPLEPAGPPRKARRSPPK